MRIKAKKKTKTKKKLNVIFYSFEQNDESQPPFELGITLQLGMQLPHFDSDLFSSTLLSSTPSKEATAFMPVPSSCDQHTDGGEKQVRLNEQVCVCGEEGKWR